MPALFIKPRYDPIAVTLHWIIAIAIICMIILGYTMTGDGVKGTPKQYELYQLHKSIGITILLLSLFRLFWRIKNPPPPLPSSLKRWEGLAANTVHWGLYALMIGIPLSGWAMVSASPLGLPTKLFGTVPWPHLPILPDLPNRGDYASVFREGHELLVLGTIGLLVLHIGAALQHHFLFRNQIVFRMAPKFMAPILRLVRGEKP
jgi:cytochrome b561